MKHTHRIRRILAAIVAAALLASGLAITSFAAGEKVVYTLQVEPGKQNPELGSIFYVSLKLKATRTGGKFNIPILRFNLHYDGNFFEPLGFNGVGSALSETDTESGLPSYTRLNGLHEGTVANGNFAIIDQSNRPDKYPRNGAGAGLNVLVVQWIAPVKNGKTTTLNVEAEGFDGNGTEILQIRFRVKETAPLDSATGGRLVIFKDYAVGNDTMPFYFQLLEDPTTSNYYDYTPTSGDAFSSTFPVDVLRADISIFPKPHSPKLEKVASAPIEIIKFDAVQAAKYKYDGIIYGFPELMTQAGTKTTWTDPQYAAGSDPEAKWLYAEEINSMLKTTNGGILQVSNTGKGEYSHSWDYGTGTKVTLYDAAKSDTYGTYYFVVFGDLDGNFIITLDDYVEFKAMLAGKREGKLPVVNSADPYDSAYHMAACVVEPTNGQALGDAEKTKLYLAALGFNQTVSEPGPLTQHPTMPAVG